MKQKSFASIIGLKPEYRERYIVLHRHTFPEVLQCIRASHISDYTILLNMVDEAVRATIMQYRDQAIGWKLSGAGGGGYLIMVAQEPIAGAMQIRIRRKNTL